MGWYSNLLLNVTFKGNARLIDLAELKNKLQDEDFLESIKRAHPEELEDSHPQYQCGVTITYDADNEKLIHINAVYKWGEADEIRLVCIAIKDLFLDKIARITTDITEIGMCDLALAGPDAYRFCFE